MHAQPTSVHKYHAPPMAKYKGMKANLKNIPRIKSRSSNRWYDDREKRKVLYVLCGSFACVILVGAVFAVPIVLTILLNKTTTTESTLSTSVLPTVISTSTNGSSTTITNGSITTTTNGLFTTDTGTTNIATT